MNKLKRLLSILPLPMLYIMVSAFIITLISIHRPELLQQILVMLGV